MKVIIALLVISLLILFVFVEYSKRNTTKTNGNEFIVTDVFFIKDIKKVIAVGNVTAGEFKTGEKVLILVENKEFKDKIIKIENMNNPETVVAKKGDYVGFMLDMMSEKTLKVGSIINGIN